MNFLVEGEKTEVNIYSKWLKYLFPQLNFVTKPEDMTINCCRIVAGYGMPNRVCRSRANNAFSRLEACLNDIKTYGHIDHFFICVDSEEFGYQERFNEIETQLNIAKSQVGIDSSINTEFHIIIQHCCIETWALGNARLPNESTRLHNSSKLADFQAFYNVLIDDPELMLCCPPNHSFSRKARFHSKYLAELLKEYGLSYKKNDPKYVGEKKYLEALKERCMNTGHLASLKVFLDILESL
ncbi:MAG: hypothetical protein DRR19_32155 [Candidatus Parabeggiatoa sp. nov. 1]|nr:MAG: hypothetical protein DRR19_32155 [Gammaproteobacteria bacterium]